MTIFHEKKTNWSEGSSINNKKLSQLFNQMMLNMFLIYSQETSW